MQCRENNSMKTIIVRYNVDSVTKQVDSGFTVGDLKESDTFRMALGFGDNMNVLISGVAQPDGLTIPDGSTLTIETAANEKATK